MMYADAWVKVFNIYFVDIDGAPVLNVQSCNLLVMVKRGFTSKTANFICQNRYEQVKCFEHAFSANKKYYLHLEVPEALPVNVYIEGSGSLYHQI